MLSKRQFIVCTLLCLGLSACTKASQEPSEGSSEEASEEAPIEISNAYVPLRGESQMHFAAYFDIANNGPQPITLQAVSSEQFKSVSLHETTLEDGMSKMRPLHGVDVRPGETVSFVPNGKHIMLMQATESIAAREVIHVQLQFTDGTALDHSIPLRKK